MRDFPDLLFSGRTLTAFADQVITTVCNQIQDANYEYLVAHQTDDLIQRLYAESEFFLPRLLLDGATHEQFEWYIAPYTDPASRQRAAAAGHNLADTSRGILFRVEVPFEGDGKFFKMAPRGANARHPVAHVGERAISIYVAQRNLSSVDPQFNLTFWRIKIGSL